MAKRSSARAGRKNNSERIRELVALLGSLSKTGDSITLDAISSRLGMSLDEARSMVDIVCQASGEEINGLLMSSNDEETEYTLQYPGTHGVPIRLTHAETMALLHALDVAGIGEDEPLRKTLGESYVSHEVAASEVRRTLGTPAEASGALYFCAKACAETRRLAFMYKGIRDEAPRQRSVRVRQLLSDNGRWYILADDLLIDEERKFNVARMSDVRLEEELKDATPAPSTEVQRVGITFTNKTYYSSFDWPGIRITKSDDNTIQGSIPYYGNQSTWLLRRICAGNGCITVDDKRIMEQAAQYARELLEA